METPQTNPSISQLSSMNAFYGIPNTSPETTAAIENGAQPPEVYSSESREAIVPEQSQETATTGAQPDSVEAYIAQATEQLDISSQALAMQREQQLQQQQQNDVNPTATNPSEMLATPPAPNSSGPQVQAQDVLNNAVERALAPNMVAGQAQTTAASEPPAATALNNESMTQTRTSTLENSQQPASNPQAASYAQFSGSGPEASTASQPGNRFSEMG